MTTSSPSRSRPSRSRTASSASTRSLTGAATSTAATLPSVSASSAAYAAWRSPMPGSMSSYRLCMIPSRPIRGRVPMASALRGLTRSALAIDVLVAVEEGVDVGGLEDLHRAERVGEMHCPRDVLAHHRGLHRVPRRRADREDAVAAHEHGGRAARAERLDDAAPDRLVADERER